MPDLFGNIADWLWWITAAVLAVLELVVPGVFFIWLAIAASLTGAVMLLLPLSIEWQLAIFGVLSIIILVLSRRFFAGPEAMNDEPMLNRRGMGYVGRQFVLEDAIVNGRGKIRVGDSVWLAAGPDLPAGAQVTVTSVDGVVLIVAEHRP